MIKIIVVGAGASGMTAAIAAAREGASVLVLEQKERVGKKLLATGNGRCNLSNVYQGAECYRGSRPEFAGQVLSRFGFQDTVRFFTELGIYTKNKNGGIYPYPEQASAVLDVLRMELRRKNVRVETLLRVEDIRKDGEEFCVTAGGREFRAGRVILACGGRAAPRTGSDGSGYELAKKMGHRIVKPLPALTQLKSREACLKAMAGVRCEAAVTLLSEGETLAGDKGELQLVDYGISGIPVFQVSRYAAEALSQNREVTARLDFMPDLEEDCLAGLLEARIHNAAGKTASELLIGLFHKKLIPVFLKRAGIFADAPCGAITKEQKGRLVRTVKFFLLSISGVNSFEHAQVSMGGVDTGQLKSTLESSLVEGLYFAGEIIDIDGRCGGYNLQWAWSSGYVAGAVAGGSSC